MALKPTRQAPHQIPAIEPSARSAASAGARSLPSQRHDLRADGALTSSTTSTTQRQRRVLADVVVAHLLQIAAREDQNRSDQQGRDVQHARCPVASIMLLPLTGRPCTTADLTSRALRFGIT